MELIDIVARVLAGLAALVLSYLLYHVSKAAWTHYSSSPTPLRSLVWKWKSRRQMEPEYCQLEDEDQEEEEERLEVEDVDEGFHDADSVASSAPFSPYLDQKPLPPKPLPDKPLPPVPGSVR